MQIGPVVAALHISVNRAMAKQVMAQVANNTREQAMKTNLPQACELRATRHRHLIDDACRVFTPSHA